MAGNVGRIMSFQLGSRDLAGARSFYEKVLSWDFGTAFGAENPLGTIDTPPGSCIPQGTTTDTTVPFGGTAVPEEYLALVVEVDDLAETCRLVEECGGTVTLPAVVNPSGKFGVAHVRDPEGNLLALFSMNVASELPRYPIAAGDQGN